MVIELFIYAGAQREIQNVRAIQQGGNPPRGIAPITIIQVPVKPPDATRMKRQSGIFCALVMPRYILTLGDQVRLREELLFTNSQDLKSAIEYIHGLGFVRI